MTGEFMFWGGILLASPVIMKVLTFRRRKLKSPTQIIEDLKSIPLPAVYEDSEMWGLKRDRIFWEDVGGFRGVLLLRQRAVHLRDLIRGLNLSPEDAEDIEFISQRCHWIMWLVALQFILLPLRGPHFFARWAAGLYFEVRTRSLTVCREYDRDLHRSLKAFS